MNNNVEDRQAVARMLTDARKHLDTSGLEYLRSDRRGTKWTQENVAEKVGITTDYYAKIERGVAKNVSLQVLTLISKTLNLNKAEQDQLFVFYLPDYFQHIQANRENTTKLPPLAQITKLLDIIGDEIVNFRYPAYVTDYKFRFWLVNPASAHLVGGMSNLQSLALSRLTIFEMVFDSNWRRFINAVDPEAMMRSQLIRFILKNRRYHKEDWYITHIESIKANLSSADFKVFKQMWDQACRMIENNEHQNILTTVPALGNRLKLRVNSEEVEFLLNDVPNYYLNEMFHIIKYEPIATPENLKRAIQIFAPASIEPCIKMWEIPGFIDSLTDELP